VRSEADGPVEAVLVLGTEGAPRRQRRARSVDTAAPEALPSSRATVVRGSAFASAADASAWLDELRGDEELVEAELVSAVAVLNRALFARRLATADPYLAEVSATRALIARVGYGEGDAVADGRYAEALELPPAGAQRVKRSMEAPDERFAALLGARERPLVAEELVLRARADLDAGRTREAALQARVALEALSGLEEHRAAVAAAANAALSTTPDASELAALTEAVMAMEAALRRHRLGG
jgi:cell division septation protein DedD